MMDGDLSAVAARLKAAVPLSAVIGQTISLRRSGRQMIALCPFHDERSPSFYVYDDHYHCFGCGAHGDVFDWLEIAGGLTLPQAVHRLSGDAVPTNALPAKRPRRDDLASAERRTVAARIWQEAGDPRRTPVEAYLRGRRISLPDPDVIRWHPCCPRRDGEVIELLPAMVALMTHPVTGEATGIHRTFLQPDGSGKAAGKAKMMLGTAGVVRLAEPEGEGLGLAEGIETALSAMQVIGWGPVWAACSRGGIEAFPVLPRHALTIFADGDDPGRIAARTCAQRWADAGCEALIHLAPDGIDWNDVAVRLTA